MERLVVPLSDAQRYLVNRLPASGEWVRVPHAVRSSTIRSLIIKGVIDHKKNITGYWDEWLSMGWVRLRHNVKVIASPLARVSADCRRGSNQ